jgi:lipopolysaccharide transport system ATP-binding protein
MSIAIRIINISKAYQLGVINTGSFSADITRWWALKRGKEDPFLKIAENNDRTSRGKSKLVWSLKDVSFDIEQGESYGIIGRNGAGKSTLLKVLSQVTHPTTGQVKIKGKIASLLEVGTGFHPELTGRENVFLNGAILGMRNTEIKKKFDEIVAFSGVERYIDTPVKRYSSGMYVRLAFAVAAHLESDILIVDEVLAVGDAEFQKKCLGKMNQLGKSSGRTILFVSHNMAAIKSLCKKAVFMEQGKVRSIGETGNIINDYLSAYSIRQTGDGKIALGLSMHGTGEARFTRFLTYKNNINCDDFFFGEKPALQVELEVKENIYDAIIGVHLVNIYGEKIFMLTPNKNYKSIELLKGKYHFNIDIDEVLMPGEYSFNLSISKHHSGADVDFLESVGKLTVQRDSVDHELDYPWATVHGYVSPRSNWTITHLSH